MFHCLLNKWPHLKQNSSHNKPLYNRRSKSNVTWWSHSVYPRPDTWRRVCFYPANALLPRSLSIMAFTKPVYLNNRTCLKEAKYKYKTLLTLIKKNRWVQIIDLASKKVQKSYFFPLGKYVKSFQRFHTGKF